MEYDVAVACGKPLLIFVGAEDMPLAAALRESDELHQKQLAFRRRVNQERVHAQFRDPDEAAAQVLAALSNLNSDAPPDPIDVAAVDHIINAETIRADDVLATVADSNKSTEQVVLHALLYARGRDEEAAVAWLEQELAGYEDSDPRRNPDMACRKKRPTESYEAE